jgi:hypothetical protein
MVRHGMPVRGISNPVPPVSLSGVHDFVLTTFVLILGRLLPGSLVPPSSDSGPSLSSRGSLPMKCSFQASSILTHSCITPYLVAGDDTCALQHLSFPSLLFLSQARQSRVSKSNINTRVHAFPVSGEGNYRRGRRCPALLEVECNRTRKRLAFTRGEGLTRNRILWGCFSK